MFGKIGACGGDDVDCILVGQGNTQNTPVVLNFVGKQAHAERNQRTYVYILICIHNYIYILYNYKIYKTKLGPKH